MLSLEGNNRVNRQHKPADDHHLANRANVDLGAGDHREPRLC
jgi:hypothetical protein